MGRCRTSAARYAERTSEGEGKQARTVSGGVYWWAIMLCESGREIDAVSVLAVAVVGDLYV